MILARSTRRRGHRARQLIEARNEAETILGAVEKGSASFISLRCAK
jgi:hypothetical protein